MLIETTQSFDTKEDAEDNLQGIKNLPGFLFGYVRQPSQPTKSTTLSTSSTAPAIREVPEQRAITSYELNEGAMYTLSTTPTILTAISNPPGPRTHQQLRQNPHSGSPQPTLQILDQIIQSQLNYGNARTPQESHLHPSNRAGASSKHPFTGRSSDNRLL